MIYHQNHLIKRWYKSFQFLRRIKILFDGALESTSSYYQVFDDLNAIKTALIHPHQIPDQRHNREPVLLPDRADPVHEPLPVERDNLENKGNALHIETVMRIRGDREGVGEPGGACVACQRNDEDKAVCSPDHDCRAFATLLVALRIGEIHEPDIPVLHRSSGLRFF
jgi:hypothetical protein